jgi:hypothetical protein
MRLTWIAAAMLAVWIAGQSQHARARGIFEDIGGAIGKAVEDAGATIEKPNTPLRGAIQETKPEHLQDAKAVYRDLIKNRSLEDLISLSVMTNPCTDIDCHGLAPDAATRLVSSALLQEQALSDALLRKQQAWAAIFSSGIALCSLVISVGSFVRAGHASRKSAAQGVGEAVPALVVVRNS